MASQGFSLFPVYDQEPSLTYSSSIGESLAVGTENESACADAIILFFLFPVHDHEPFAANLAPYASRLLSGLKTRPDAGMPSYCFPSFPSTTRNHLLPT